MLKLFGSRIRADVVLGILLFHFLSFFASVTALSITSDPAQVVNKTFTHVVVGGGTAGLVVASRLAEDSRFSVLVIEAGADEQNNTIVNDPAQTTSATMAFSWQYQTTPQTVGGNVVTIFQGKLLGGSSSVNGMQWTRATLDQYDSFERLGNTGWDAESLFQFMQKSEAFIPPSPDQVSLGATADLSVHGTSGPVSISYPEPYLATETFGAYIASMISVFSTSPPQSSSSNNTTEASYTPLKQILDLCTGAPLGLARFFYSLLPGRTQIPGGNRRTSSAWGYVYPFLAEPEVKEGLTILAGHQSTGIVWSSGGNQSVATATGVKFVATPASTIIGDPLANEFTVAVSGEVIVAAGALGSPHFLELSGIGNRTILEQAGIPVKVDLPSVGTNLQDQPLTISFYAIKPTLPSIFNDTTNEIGDGSVGYLSLSHIIGTDAAAIAAEELMASVSQRAEEIVDMGGFSSVSGMEKVLTEQAQAIARSDTPVIEMSFATNLIQGAFGHQIWNLLPQSRGTVHVQSSSPFVLPQVNPNYLITPFDLSLHVNATKLSRQIFATSPLSELVEAELSPGLVAVPPNASDATWQSFVESGVMSVDHPAGTVPMLPREDGGSVDARLKVYGTGNVRVVDSSIIPVQISAHLSATVYGIAEKAADMIKEDFLDGA